MLLASSTNVWKAQPAAEQALLLFCSFSAAACPMSVVIDVEEVAEEARVGVMIVKSMATVRPRHDDTRRSAWFSWPSGSVCSEAVVIPAIGLGA